MNLNELKKSKLVAVIRTSTAEKAKLAIDAVISGGFNFIEITWTIPEVSSVVQYAINKYKNRPDIFIGAGTITTLQAAKEAWELGCTYIVAPNFRLDISEYAKNKKLEYIPGFMTMNELAMILNEGWNLLKLFPGNNFSPNYIKNINGPFPNTKIMVTGGIDTNNMKEWFAAGIYAAGIGGNLTEAIEKNNDFDACVKEATLFQAEVQKWA